jgi:hypothetical protein
MKRDGMLFLSLCSFGCLVYAVIAWFPVLAISMIGGALIGMVPNLLNSLHQGAGAGGGKELEHNVKKMTSNMREKAAEKAELHANKMSVWVKAFFYERPVSRWLRKFETPEAAIPTFIWVSARGILLVLTMMLTGWLASLVREKLGSVGALLGVVLLSMFFAHRAQKAIAAAETTQKQ